jgi:hypothetical protein
MTLLRDFLTSRVTILVAGRRKAFGRKVSERHRNRRRILFALNGRGQSRRNLKCGASASLTYRRARMKPEQLFRYWRQSASEDQSELALSGIGEGYETVPRCRKRSSSRLRKSWEASCLRSASPARSASRNGRPNSKYTRINISWRFWLVI